MSGHDAKYFTTTKKGEIHELKEELNSQYKVRAFPIPACAWEMDSSRAGSSEGRASEQTPCYLSLSDMELPWGAVENVAY